MIDQFIIHLIIKNYSENYIDQYYASQKLIIKIFPDMGIWNGY